MLKLRMGFQTRITWRICVSGSAREVPSLISHLISYLKFSIIYTFSPHPFIFLIFSKAHLASSFHIFAPTLHFPIIYMYFATTGLSMAQPGTCKRVDMTTIHILFGQIQDKGIDASLMLWVVHCTTQWKLENTEGFRCWLQFMHCTYLLTLPEYFRCGNGNLGCGN